MKNLVSLSISFIFISCFIGKAQNFESPEEANKRYVKIGETLYHNGSDDFKALVDLLVEDLKSEVTRASFYKTKAFLSVLEVRKPSSKYASLFKKYNTTYTQYLQNLKKGFIENETELLPEDEVIYETYLAEAEVFFKNNKTLKKIKRYNLNLDKDNNEILSKDSFYKFKAYAKVAANYGWLDFISEDLSNLSLNYEDYVEKLTNTMILASDQNVKNKGEKENYAYVSSPIYQGCDPTLSNQQINKCTKMKIQEYFNEHFNKKKAKRITGQNKLNLVVNFDIDSNGEIENIQGYTSSNEINELIKETLENLPKLQPAISDGKAVKFNYVMRFYNGYAKPIKIDTSKRGPIYSGCSETLSHEDLKKCMSSKIQSFISDGLTGEAEKLLYNGTYKVSIRFLVNKYGTIDNIEGKSDQAELIPIAEDLISALPKMKPATINNKATGVMYTLPITIVVENSKKQSKQPKAPIYPGCDMGMSNAELYICMQEKIQRYFHRQIKKSNLSENMDSGKYSVTVNFTIKNDGKIADITTDGLFSTLNNEAKEIIKNLPPIFPAKKDNEPVESKHSFTFNVQID